MHIHPIQRRDAMLEKARLRKRTLKKKQKDKARGRRNQKARKVR